MVEDIVCMRQMKSLASWKCWIKAMYQEKLMEPLVATTLNLEILLMELKSNASVRPIWNHKSKDVPLKMGNATVEVVMFSMELLTPMEFLPLHLKTCINIHSL